MGAALAAIFAAKAAPTINSLSWLFLGIVPKCHVLQVKEIHRHTNAVKLSRSLSGVEAILLASTPLSQRFILPGGA